MVFSSYEFLFVFLPIVAAIGIALRHEQRPALRVAVVLAMSLVFYSYWEVRFLPVLLTSIGVNFLLARQIRGAEPGRAKAWLVLGIVLNLSALAFFKYTTFLLNSLAGLLGLEFAAPHIDLPLGISFFTFLQIAFLVDIHEDRSRWYGLGEYALFVTFFPHLIAGPLVHHSNLIPQFRQTRFMRWRADDVVVGLVFLSIGLFKKVIIADSLASFADGVFAAAASGQMLSTFEAWGGALAYTFQLYFDFSGYADMAIGLGWMFGIKLPENFNAPYRATSISEFWRRWHMTLSAFLRDYLYIRLGGNRRGPARRYVNLMLTMLLGGLWHGAGWTFVLWGGLHGLYLCLHQLWRGLARSAGLPGLPAPLGWAATFLAVVVAWVPFRAANLAATLAMWRSMFTQLSIPQAFDGRLGPLQAGFEALGFSFVGPAQVALRDWLYGLPLIGAALLIVLLLPTTQAYGDPESGLRRRVAAFGAAAGSEAVLLAGMMAAAVVFMSRNSVFIYFQF